MVRFEVWDPEGIVETLLITKEKAAILCKESMERRYDRVFRMRKIFDDGKMEEIVPPDYISVTLVALPGDIVTSKNGFLMHSSMTGKTYLTKKVEVMSNGGFCALDEKREIHVKPG